MSWMTLLDKYGWPAFGLVIVGMFFWRCAWPVALQYIEKTNQRADVAEAFFREYMKATQEQNERSETRSNALVDDFLRCNLRLQDTNDKTVEELRRLNDHISRLR
jgi:hypothetical protein